MKNKKFRRHPRLLKLGEKWRRPKTRTNKIRRKKKGKNPMPVIGYGSPESEKNIHPSGLKEIMISNTKELDKIDNKKECVRIRSSVGKRKRIEILKKSKEKEIEVLNPGKDIKKSDKKEKKGEVKDDTHKR